MQKTGDRIGAVLSASDGVVKLLGYGVYAGDEVPPRDGGWMAECLNDAGATNPKLVLDNGQVVWGCQCWWGSESATRERFKGYRVESVVMADVLAEKSATQPSEEG